MLGVRLPALRAMAKQLAKTPEDSLAALGDATFEERMLRGMILGGASLEPARRRALLEAFLPLVDNWSVCDSTAVSCRFLKKDPVPWLPWLRELSARDQEFTARFGLVCLLDHFTDTPQGRRQVLECCRAARCTELYTRLAQAWAVSVVAVKEPSLGEAFLSAGVLAPDTQNRAIRKICESYRAAPDYKKRVRTLRR